MPMAIPAPKTILAMARLLCLSPKANSNPPATIATSESPRAIGPVKVVCSTFTASTQGLVP